MKYDHIELEIDGVRARIALCVKEGRGVPLLLLHGFGSTKEDYADLAHHPRFRNRTIIIYDAPGHGDTECSDLSALSIPFLVAAAERVIERLRLLPFHLAGHSMGGLTALMLAARAPGAVLSFTDIEGNLTPEDCFLSRQIETHPAATGEEFFNAFIGRVWRSAGLSNPIYARGLREKVRADAAAPIFRSMVKLSDRGNLLETFLHLPCRKMFVYGSETRSLSYLGALGRHGVRLAEIPHSGHFPMYANPPALWRHIAEFIDRTERNRPHDR